MSASECDTAAVAHEGGGKEGLKGIKLRDMIKMEARLSPRTGYH